MTSLPFLALALMLSGAGEASYTNPVCTERCADPSLIREGDTFWLCSTESHGRVNVRKSRDLVHWEWFGSAFPSGGKPSWNGPGYAIWAPCLNKIGDYWIMYYSLAKWGEHERTGIGVAYAESPEGPWTDAGKLFDGQDTGAGGCIDPCFFADESGNWLFWGSFHGIFAVKMADDGLSVEGNFGPGRIQIAGTAYEGSYIHKRDGWYYLFASTGSCCRGAESTYKTVVGRSRNLLGPYVDKKGRPMMKNHHEVIISGNGKPFVGTGHNAEIVTDNAGTDWILYHSYSNDYIKKGRLLMLDRVDWVDGWPVINDGTPTLSGKAPVVEIR